MHVRVADHGVVDQPPSELVDSIPVGERGQHAADVAVSVAGVSPLRVCAEDLGEILGMYAPSGRPPVDRRIARAFAPVMAVVGDVLRMPRISDIGTRRSSGVSMPTIEAMVMMESSFSGTPT